MTTPDKSQVERKTHTGHLGERPILMFEPNEAQLVVLTRIAALVEAGDGGEDLLMAVRLLGDVLDSLIVEKADLYFVLNRLATSRDGNVQPYTDLLLKTFDHMIASTQAANRSERRAVRRAPRR
jgi:hypothetical protein